ncbi:hypothetical protein GCM10029963_24310 [Micromonospora andamanensis]
MQRLARYDGPALDLPDGFPTSLSQALRRAADRFPEAGTVAVSTLRDAEFVPYPVLLDRARRLLTGLRRQGLAAGDHVVLYGSDPLHFFTMFWACALGGFRPSC